MKSVEERNIIYHLKCAAEREYRNVPADMRGLGVGLQNTYKRYGLTHDGRDLDCYSFERRNSEYNDYYDDDEER